MIIRLVSTSAGVLKYTPKLMLKELQANVLRLLPNNQEDFDNYTNPQSGVEYLGFNISTPKRKTTIFAGINVESKLATKLVLLVKVGRNTSVSSFSLTSEGLKEAVRLIVSTLKL